MLEFSGRIEEITKHLSAWGDIVKVTQHELVNHDKLFKLRKFYGLV